MLNKLSHYEENQVNQFLYDLYEIWGGSLDKDTCISEGWITYLEGRDKYQYDIGDEQYWEYVQENVREKISKLKK